MPRKKPASVSALPDRPIVDPIDPDEWIIVTQIPYEGVIYSRGEPLPPLTAAVVQTYVQSGDLCRRDAPVLTPAQQKPGALPDYLRGADLFVIQRLRNHPLSVDDLQELRAMAKTSGRSDLLLEILDCVIDYAAAAAPVQVIE